MGVSDEPEEQPKIEMFADSVNPDAESCIHRDAISTRALSAYRRRHGDDNISKENIFWYV